MSATGKVVWQKTWPEACYSGTATTAGGLVFVGRNAGQLQAYDAKNRQAAVELPDRRRRERLSDVLPGKWQAVRRVLRCLELAAGTPHGDSFWLFSLDGKLGPAPPPPCGSGNPARGGGRGRCRRRSPQPVRRSSQITARSVTERAVPAATVVLTSGCLSRRPRPWQGSSQQVTDGGGGMPAFKGTLTRKQIADVAAVRDEEHHATRSSAHDGSRRTERRHAPEAAGTVVSDDDCPRRTSGSGVPIASMRRIRVSSEDSGVNGSSSVDAVRRIDRTEGASCLSHESSIHTASRSSSRPA